MEIGAAACNYPASGVTKYMVQDLLIFALFDMNTAQA